MQIAIPVYERFTALDAIGPYEVLSRLPGAKVTFLAAEPGPIATDNGMLRIVAENLAENAIRYAGHGARFTFNVSRAGDFVVLTASDDGVGVPPAALERLFERFYRADAARRTRGTGLGLAIVKHIVVAAGGDIDADGGPGQGLRIRATFPG